MVGAHGARAAAEAYGGEGLRADVHEEAGVTKKVGAEKGVLDLGDDEVPDVGLIGVHHF